MLGDDVRQTSVCRVFAANDKLKFVGHSGEWIDPATLSVAVLLLVKGASWALRPAETLDFAGGGGAGLLQSR